MKQSIIQSIVAGVAALGLISGCSTEQAKPVCFVGTGGFATVYKLVNNPNNCDEDHQLKSELIGGQRFDDPSKPLPQVVLQPENAYAAAAEVSQAQAAGQFSTAMPDKDGICTVQSLSPIDADDVKYEFSNVRIHSTAAVSGTEIMGNVKLTVAGCQADYTFFGIAPTVSCLALDADGNPQADPNLPGGYLTDPTLCDTQAHPELGRATGAPINPAFQTECNPYSGYCVAKGDTFTQE